VLQGPTSTILEIPSGMHQSIDEQALKQAIKEVLLETLEERRELFLEIFEEVMEEYAIYPLHDETDNEIAKRGIIYTGVMGRA